MESRKAKTRVAAMVVLCACGILAYTLIATGGNLEPIAPPGPTMYSLEEIYNLIGSQVQKPKAFNCFIKFEGIDGESTDPDHLHWCDFLAYSHGVTQPLAGATGATRRRGDVVVKDFTVVKLLDKASIKLSEACCRGDIIPRVEIELCLASGNREILMKYELRNALPRVIDHFTAGATSANRPLEEVTLSYEEIKWIYTVYDPQTGAPMGMEEFEWRQESPL